MTKVVNNRPGPKSSKLNHQSKIIFQRGSLGESNSDDSDAEYTVNDDREIMSKTAKLPSPTNGNASEFCTPDREIDATDYGLEFTTSHIQNPSPRRCSTFRTAGSSQERQQIAGENTNNSAKENDAPLSSQRKSAAKSKPPKKQQRPTKSKTVAKPKDPTTSASQAPAVGTNPMKKPRKQYNPMQREKRFWKEVQILQNRTNYLIPMLPFSRLVRELMQDASTEVTKITSAALEALQTSSEMYLTQRLQDAYMLTLHRGRVTLDVKDLALISYLQTNL